MGLTECINNTVTIGICSNGKIRDFESRNEGSIPSIPATSKIWINYEI